MVRELTHLSPQVLRAASTYLSTPSPSSRRVAPRSLLPAGPGTPALHPAGPEGPGGAQQGPEPGGRGCRERPLHHPAHEPLAVCRAAPGPRPAGLLPLLMLEAQGHAAGGAGGRPAPGQRAPSRSQRPRRPSRGRLPPPRALPFSLRASRTEGVAVGDSKKSFPSPDEVEAGTEATLCPDAISGRPLACTHPSPANNMYFMYDGQVFLFFFFL